MFSTRYVPKTITRKDRKKVIRMLTRSKKLYKKQQYYTRKKIPSFKSKKSGHLANAYRIYNITSLVPNKELATKTGCKISAMKQIIRKGKGAYFSSGSRPNQTPQSWGVARLASALTAGKAAAIDYHILEKGCDHKKKAFILATESLRKNHS
jgi:hypothetical protein